jgi:glycosyltransferase involved in cell wall biosynthesis
VTLKLTVDYRMSRSSGIGVNVRNTVQGLAGAYREDFRVVLLGGDPGPPGVEQRSSAAPIYSLAEQIELTARAPRDTDVFWSPHYNAPWVSPGRLVVTVNDVYHLDLPAGAARGVKSIYARAMFASIARRAARIVCISKYTANELMSRTGIDAGRISVVYPGPGVEWGVGGGAGHPTGRPYVLFVGNVKPHKNLVRLLAAFERIAGRVPHSLVIVGKREGFITPDREVAAAAERLGDRVAFTGELSDDALRTYYANADLLVHPSLYEGFGFPPLEAMAQGVPVAVSRATAIPEVCGDAAAYFDPRSVPEMAVVIERALTDAGLRGELREKGRQQVRRYSWSSTVREMAEIFRGVAAR